MPLPSFSKCFAAIALGFVIATIISPTSAGLLAGDFIGAVCDASGVCGEG